MTLPSNHRAFGTRDPGMPLNGTDEPMTTPNTLLTKVRVEGFRSIKEATVDLGPMNVLIGPNGAGKSNLLTALRLPPIMRAQGLRRFVGTEHAWQGQAVLRGAGDRSDGPRSAPHEVPALRRVGPDARSIRRKERMTTITEAFELPRPDDTGAMSFLLTVELRPRSEDALQLGRVCVLTSAVGKSLPRILDDGVDHDREEGESLNAIERTSGADA